MTITELQTLLMNSITIGAFMGFFIGAILSIFGRQK